MKLDDLELDRESNHPVFNILKKILKFVHENDFENFIVEKSIQKINWVMKPLEESGAGIMQYRVIAIMDGKKVRIEKDSIYEPSSFNKQEAELFISKIMDNHPDIEQNVNLMKIYKIDTAVFEKVNTKKKLSM